MRVLDNSAILDLFLFVRADTRVGDLRLEGVPRRVPDGLTVVIGEPRLTGVWAYAVRSERPTLPAGRARIGANGESAAEPELALMYLILADELFSLSRVHGSRQERIGEVYGGCSSNNDIRPGD